VQPSDLTTSAKTSQYRAHSRGILRGQEAFQGADALRPGSVVRGPRRRRNIAVLSLLACLLLASCTQRDRGSKEDRQDGFYGGISAGNGM
jgi:hypothetical protein